MRKVMFCFLVMLFICGCGAEMTEKTQQKHSSVKTEQEVDDRTPGERAMVIKERLKQMDGIIGTAVVVEGHTAIIGLLLEKDMEQNEISAVRTKAESLAKNADASVENVLVTSNAYVVSMIEDAERKRAG